MLKDIYVLPIRITIMTGLHIGGSSDSFDIGGADSTVIRNPLTYEPYIPGSSLKGKVKALLTYLYGKKEKEDMVIVDESIRNIFEPVENNGEICMTRAIFRDAFLTQKSKANLEKHLGVGVYTEIKAENKIYILKGKAANPRFIERVPAGAEFEGQIVLQVFEGDEGEKMQAKILEGLKLLELNYLGGNGTRGYGRVKIEHDGFIKLSE